MLGEYDLTLDEGWERRRWVTFIVVHPEYDYYTHHADVALVRLGFYVFYSQRIGILQLPDRTSTKKDVTHEEGERERERE